MVTIILIGFTNGHLLKKLKKNYALEIREVPSIDVLETQDRHYGLVICRITRETANSVINFIKSGNVKKPFILIFDGNCRPPLEKIRSLPETSFLWSPVLPSYLLKTIQLRLEEKKNLLQIREEDSILNEYIGQSEAILHLKKQISSLNDKTQNLLLQGESGTGKDLIARLIHKKISTKDSPYICRNCAAIPESLFESELFGTAKGAYTDAVTRPGCFEQAHNGTLFLDEIGELTKPYQAKLLRIIEDKNVLRLGETTERLLNFRLISATNKNLRKAVRKGIFRKDLYYRINTLILKIPPLRKRKSDIPLLIDHFLKDKEKRMNINACDKMLEYKWPGNIRELSSVINRAIIFSGDKDEIEPDDIAFY